MSVVALVEHLTRVLPRFIEHGIEVEFDLYDNEPGLEAWLGGAAVDVSLGIDPAGIMFGWELQRPGWSGVVEFTPDKWGDWDKGLALLWSLGDESIIFRRASRRRLFRTPWDLLAGETVMASGGAAVPASGLARVTLLPTLTEPSHAAAP